MTIKQENSTAANILERIEVATQIEKHQRNNVRNRLHACGGYTIH